MLILREKTILVDSQPVKLYSLDGKLWVSKPHDVKVFKQRRARYISAVQTAVATHVHRLPTWVPYSWLDAPSA